MQECILYRGVTITPYETVQAH